MEFQNLGFTTIKFSEWVLIHLGNFKINIRAPECLTVDLLSTIPLDSLAGIFLDEATAAQFKLFGCLKLIRVIRLNRIIRDLNVPGHIKVILKLFKLTFFLFLYVHFQSCVWF